MTTDYADEKRFAHINDDAISSPQSANASIPETKAAVLEAREIFHDDSGQGVKFRTVSWQSE